MSPSQQNPPALQAAAAAAEDGDDAAVVREEIWLREDSDWHLTWPIWHMLPRQERKELAQKHGYKTIGEFEEFMSLQQAVGDSSSSASMIRPYENQLLYSSSKNKPRSADLTDTKPAATTVVTDDEDDDNDSNSQLEQDMRMEQEQTAAADKLPTQEWLQRGGAILVIPEETLHKIFAWLPVDTYATLALVSPHWKSFTRTEAVYKRLCERLYLNQSERKQLHVSRFQNSYRTMLERRPRVRAGGGVYILKYAKVKKIERNMWTDIPVGAVLELVYYRYLYFQEDGRVLYALTPSPPHEMFPRLRRVCLTGQSDRAAVWGRYTVQKTAVTVIAEQEWQFVQLQLSIVTKQGDYHPMHGRNGCLSLDRHLTSKSGDFGRSDRLQHEVPEEPFRFVKDKRL